MEVYYDKSEFRNDKTFQFIRDLDLPVEPGIDEPLYKLSNTYNNNTGRISRTTNLAQVSHQSNKTVIDYNHSEYFDVETNEILAISEYAHGENVYKYCDTGQQVSNYSSDDAGLATPQNNLDKTYQHVDTGKNFTMSEYSDCDIQVYTDNIIIETPNENQAAAAVGDVIDPHGRGFQASEPETPVFSTGIVTPKKDLTEPKADCCRLNRVINYRDFVLFLADESDITKPKVDRPAGCKTLFISGIPERMTRMMVKEVFRKYGKIVDIYLGTNHCYLRFASTSSVDNALELSGYVVCIRDRKEPPYCSKIHIDFVPVRKEELEYEREKQKEAMKEPQRPLMFTIRSASTVTNQLRHEESLDDGVKSLIYWMERGVCNKSTAGSFFSFLQAIQGLVSRLMKDTAKVEEEARQHQCRLNAKYAANSLLFATILKAFDMATSKKIWDNFSKTQRSKISQWKKHINEIKESNSRDLISNRVEEKMDLSDDESLSSDKQQDEELKRLQEENKRLKSELKSVKDENFRIEPKYIPMNCGEGKTADIDGGFGCQFPDNADIAVKEARLIALVGAFLTFHRFGECVDSIFNYVSKFDSSFAIEEIQSLLRKFPTVFRETVHEKKWTFL